MPQFRTFGNVPKKRHTQHSVSPGYRNEGIYYEEVITTRGFSRAYSIVYHLRPPTRVKNIEQVGEQAIEYAKDLPLRHVHLRTKDLPVHGDPIGGRIPLFANADVTMSRCRPGQPQAELYRNASADEVCFLHSGAGSLHSQFGTLKLKPFDYVVIPKTTTYRLDFDADAGQPDLLVIESPSAIGYPPRYLNPDGQFRLGAPFCERDIHGPRELQTIDEDRDTTVLIKDGPKFARYTLAHHPFDVIGWDGMVYPFTFNADDFEPITGTIHQPPPIHQTFESDGFVICTFAPRMLDTHPLAIKVPYAHSNVESDEVLYYVRGQFGSRRGVDIGSFTLHPHGIPHGPHPGTIVASRNVARTDELAVMLDTFRPLNVTRAALAYDDPKYPFSWME
jgi:homogentisate 1,2-dioxygenase